MRCATCQSEHTVSLSLMACSVHEAKPVRDRLMMCNATCACRQHVRNAHQSSIDAQHCGGAAVPAAGELDFCTHACAAAAPKYSCHSRPTAVQPSMLVLSQAAASTAKAVHEHSGLLDGGVPPVAASVLRKSMAAASPPGTTAPEHGRQRQITHTLHFNHVYTLIVQAAGLEIALQASSVRALRHFSAAQLPIRRRRQRPTRCRRALKPAPMPPAPMTGCRRRPPSSGSTGCLRTARHCAATALSLSASASPASA